MNILPLARERVYMSAETGLVEILTGVGLAVGAFVGGLSWAKGKLPLLKTGTKTPSLSIDQLNTRFPEKSTKTSGSKHVSEEGLSRFVKIEKEYVEKDKHELMCSLVQADMKEHVSKEIGHAKDEIIKVIKDSF